MPQDYSKDVETTLKSEKSPFLNPEKFPNSTPKTEIDDPYMEEKKAIEISSEVSANQVNDFKVDGLEQKMGVTNPQAISSGGEVALNSNTESELTHKLSSK